MLNAELIASVLPMSRPVVIYGFNVDSDGVHLGKGLLVYSWPNKILPALTVLPSLDGKEIS